MTNYSLHAIRLPGGDANYIEDWWIRDGHWTQTPVTDAIPLPGRYAIAGMVDAHAHLSMDMGVFGLPDASAPVIEANVGDKLRQGITAVRDAGALPEIAVNRSSSQLIDIVPTGKLISPPGHGYPRICTPVGEDQLVDYALREIAEGMQWVKVIAEFPIGEINHFASVPTYSLDALQRLCNAAHSKGARVAMHTATPYAVECVRAGADSIEHGPGLTPAALAEMAQRNIAWVPTLTTVIGVCEFLVGADVPPTLKAQANTAMDNVRNLLPIAEKLGVTVMAGTDEHPADFVGELKLLAKYGLSPSATLRAASDMARTYLRLSQWREGEPANVTLFDADPRESLDELSQPLAVVARGCLLDAA